MGDDDYDPQRNGFWSWLQAMQLADTESLVRGRWQGTPKNQLAAELSANGIEPLTINGQETPTGLRNICRIRCACGGHLDIDRRQGIALQQLFREFRGKGWEFGHHRWICAVCQTKRREKTEKPKEAPTMTAAPVTNHPVTLGSAPREPNLAETAKIIQILNERFNTDRGAYQEGWSDERISHECNVPRLSVIQIREATHGKLKMDPEVVRLRSDVEAAGQLHAELGAQLTELKTRLVALEKRHSR